VPHLSPGDLLNGRYEVDMCVGEGAMSAVYRVKDRRLPGAEWAAKELIEYYLPEGEREMARSLFQREGEILSGLHHPGLPRVVDRFSEPGGRHYLVMEFIPGEPLDDILSHRHRPLAPEEALPIALQCTHVLEYLHSRNPPIVFRDLKPSNLMLTPDGLVRFIDFGIARFYSARQPKDTQELGTPGFCAPEQYGHGQTTPRSDIYSLGATLFHLLTLEDPRPFQFKFPPLTQFHPNVPQVLEKAVHRCLQLRPQDRYPSAAALRSDLVLALRRLKPPSDSATQTLSGPLSALARHRRWLEESEGQAAWRFWKDWLLRTFNLEAGPPAGSRPSP
jgi:serine/threonine-protein kinase